MTGHKQLMMETQLTLYIWIIAKLDSVPHLKLLSKLESYGIKGSLLRWIKNFLTRRIQRIVINGCKSSFLPVSSGIPQGSILGQTLFLIYVNNLPEGILSSLKLFVDDTKLYRVIKLETDRDVLQQDINRLMKWTEV